MYLVITNHWCVSVFVVTLVTAEHFFVLTNDFSSVFDHWCVARALDVFSSGSLASTLFVFYATLYIFLSYFQEIMHWFCSLSQYPNLFQYVKLEERNLWGMMLPILVSDAFGLYALQFPVVLIRHIAINIMLLKCKSRPPILGQVHNIFKSFFGVSASRIDHWVSRFYWHITPILTSPDSGN